MPWRASCPLPALLPSLFNFPSSPAFDEGGDADHVGLEGAQLGQDLLHPLGVVERDLLEGHDLHGGHVQRLKEEGNGG